jgi:Protein of unknown function (DUF1360)
VTTTFSSPSPPRPWYAALIATYLTGVAGLALLVRRRDSTPTVEARDLIVLAAATNTLARLGTQKKVTEPLRAPFTEPVEEPDGTRHEQPQRRGARRAVGELVTCPFCLSVWIATALTGALLLAPRRPGSRCRRSPR